MKRIILTLCLCASVVWLGGCAHQLNLEAGGVYAPVNTNLDGTITIQRDTPLALADSSFMFYYDTINRVFHFERDNRAQLWKVSPEIKHSLDAIRPGCLAAKDGYLQARETYIASGGATNEWNTLQGALQNLKTYSVVVQEAINNRTKGNP